MIQYTFLYFERVILKIFWMNDQMVDIEKMKIEIIDRLKSIKTRQNCTFWQLCHGTLYFLTYSLPLTMRSYFFDTF